MTELRTSDGRTLEWHSQGPEDGPLVLYSHGTPSDARLVGPLADELVRRGVRLVGMCRPGYRTSTRLSGRRVADVAVDVGALLAELDRTEFRSIGWSGGGPHALAVAALIPGCLKVVTLAGVAPHDSPGLAWTEGMGEDNVKEFHLASEGEAALRGLLDPMAGILADLSAEVLLAGGMGDLLSAEDNRALQQPGEADRLANSLRRALELGNDGHVDDDLAFVNPWGFALSTLRVPVELWQGDSDRMVPHAHAIALATALPGSTLHLLPDDGHISLVYSHAVPIANSLLS